MIVDANVAHEMFSAEPTETGIIVRDWISKGSNRLVIGGHNTRELYRMVEAKRWTIAAWQAGKVRIIKEEEIDQELTAIANADVTCNDRHMLALARASGARVLFTNDQALMDDFRNTDIVSPRGWIFNRPAHRRNLIDRKECCIAP